MLFSTSVFFLQNSLQNLLLCIFCIFSYSHSFALHLWHVLRGCAAFFPAPGLAKEMWLSMRKLCGPWICNPGRHGPSMVNSPTTAPIPQPGSSVPKHASAVGSDSLPFPAFFQAQRQTVVDEHLLISQATLIVWPGPRTPSAKNYLKASAKIWNSW